MISLIAIARIVYLLFFVNGVLAFKVAKIREEAGSSSWAKKDGWAIKPLESE